MKDPSIEALRIAALAIAFAMILAATISFILGSASQSIAASALAYVLLYFVQSTGGV